MAKFIKKSFKYFIIIIGVILMLRLILYPALQISYVQTYIVNRILGHVAEGINSEISVGKIKYKFFNKLAINDILIKDQNKDTLIYAKTIVVVIRDFDIKKKSISLGKIEIMKPVVAFITDSTGLMNLNWYLNLLKSRSDTTSTKAGMITIDQIDLSDARFALINQTAGKGKSLIDFNDLKVNSINGIIEDFKIKDDTTSFRVYNLSFNELSGFTVKKMSSAVVIARQNIQFNSAFINTESSIFNISEFSIQADSSGSFRKILTDVKLKMVLEKSLISSSDLRYFLPFANGIDESVWLSGKVFGTVSELRGRKIELSYRDNTFLDCDFDLSGLPKIENAFMYFGVNSLRTNAADIEMIKKAAKSRIDVPPFIYKLGNIAFDGSFTGFTTDFVTYGEIRTSKGNIRTDISLRPEKSKKYRIKGSLTGTDINLGELSGKPDLFGNLSIRTEVDGYAYSFKKFAAKLTGKIDSVEIKKYEYRNIGLNGNFTEKTWDGSVNVSDDNIKLDLLGMFNFSQKLPEFDFTLNLTKANLYKLHLDRLDSTASVTMLLTSNFKGNNIDNLDGEIKLLNSTYIKYNTSLELYDLSLKTYKENNKPVLSLRTGFVDADIKGKYNFAALGALIKSTLASLMPSKFMAPAPHIDAKNNSFTFEINLKNTDKINSFFRTGVLLADKSYIRGEVFPDSIIKIAGKAGFLNIKNTIFNDLSLDADMTGSNLSVDIKSSKLSLLNQSDLKDFSVRLTTKPDNFIFSLDWDNQDSILNRGSFKAFGGYTKAPDRKTGAILTINIDSTDVYARNNLWKISKSSLLIDSTAIDINKFYISNKDHYYLVDGSVSKNPSDTLNLEFNGIDISPLNYLGNQKNNTDPNRLRYDFKGLLYGKVQMTNVYSNLLLESNIVVNDFSVLGGEFGNIAVTSDFDRAKKVVNINAINNLKGVKMIDINGFYDPALKKINLSAEVSKVPIVFLNPLLRVFASEITGSASGKVNFSILQGQIELTGAVMAENAVMKVNYLQTKFKLNDSIRFDKNGFKFNNIKLTDEKGNNAYLSGRVNQKNFKEFSADLIVNANDCLVLNTKPKDNDLFYGTAYASGVTTIKTGPNSLAFDISAKTGKNTKFYIPLNNGLSVSDYSFITFLDSKTDKDIKGDPEDIRVKSAPVQTGLDLNFDLEVTPEAEAQLIFDSKVGDVMKGHGSGNLNISLNKKGEFKINGDYIVEEGDYLFTLGNILNKSFSVENGGKIMFNGDIGKAEIDIKAIYKLKASLYEILQDEKFKERIPVECQLNLSGNLWNPVVGFNIYLPTADEKTRTYLKNVISTEEELSRQFVYLLVMNSFYADPGLSSTQSASSPSGTSAMAVTTTEMLSNQLSNWLSQISNDFDIGFVYRPGSGNKDINPQEVQVALSTQLLNDKVLINGNFDVRGTGSGSDNTNQITGDFDADIKITQKLNFKVFNRYNNPYTGKGVDYTQGIGIFFKQDFDRLVDLFKKKTKTDKKKVKEITPEKK